MICMHQRTKWQTKIRAKNPHDCHDTLKTSIEERRTTWCSAEILVQMTTVENSMAPGRKFHGTLHPSTLSISDMLSVSIVLVPGDLVID